MSRPDLPLHIETLGRPAAPTEDTFVLVHGYGASSFTWRHWAPELAKLGHVVQVDLKGFGRAPKPADDRYAPADQAALVRRLIQERDLRNVTLVGHSIGGGVALLVALALLEDGSSRLSRLVIVSGAAYEQRLPPFVALAERPRLSSLLFRLVGPRRVVRWALRAIVHDSAVVTEEQVRGYATPLASGDAMRVLLSAARQIVPPDLEELARRYPEIVVPTLLVWGRQDRVVPLAIGVRLSEALPAARLRVLERCGHLPAEEKPDESWELLRRFLTKTSDGPSG